MLYKGLAVHMIQNFTVSSKAKEEDDELTWW